LTLSLSTQKLIDIMSDSDWYSLEYLGYAAGKFIPPEVAVRKVEGKDSSYVLAGQRVCICARLRDWRHLGKAERRMTENSPAVQEWRLIGDWFMKEEK